MTFYLKECKRILFSLTFALYTIALAAMFISQVRPGIETINKPVKGQESYGWTTKDDPDLVMPAAVQSLYDEYRQNDYRAYPMGFLKYVKLDDGERVQMEQILSELTGIPKSSLEGNELPEDYQVAVAKGLSYVRFKELMNEADGIIGGGSSYGESYLVSSFGTTQKDYDTALREYDQIVNEDHITGAMARLFSDYMGIMLGILPVFVVAALILKDRRSGVRPLIYTRKFSTVRIVGTRYLAMVTMLVLPVLALGAYETVVLVGMNPNAQLDLLAFPKYILGWLLPTIMTVSALGLLLTELTDTPVVIAVQMLWWFLCVNMGFRQMGGGYEGLPLFPRHNSSANTQIFRDRFGTLAFNRVFYVVLALALVVLSMLVYEMKRKGKLRGYADIRKIFGNRQKKHQA